MHDAIILTSNALSILVSVATLIQMRRYLAAVAKDAVKTVENK